MSERLVHSHSCFQPKLICYPPHLAGHHECYHSSQANAFTFLLCLQHNVSLVEVHAHCIAHYGSEAFNFVVLTTSEVNMSQVNSVLILVSCTTASIYITFHWCNAWSFHCWQRCCGWLESWLLACTGFVVMTHVAFHECFVSTACHNNQNLQLLIVHCWQG